MNILQQQEEDNKVKEIEKIESAIKIKKEEGDVNVIISSQSYKQKVNNPFVILFYESFDCIIEEYQLNMLEMRIILKLLKKASLGNLLSFKQASIANELKTLQPTVSRAFTKLIKSTLLIKTQEGELYFNPQIFAKGNLKKMKDSKIYDDAIDIRNLENY
ncbi:MAG: hypothetical protein WC656_04965 [Sulfurimonas sp.]